MGIITFLPKYNLGRSGNNNLPSQIQFGKEWESEETRAKVIIVFLTDRMIEPSEGRFKFIP